MTTQIGIIMGSQSDWEIMKNASDILDDLGINNECRVISAHRTPEELAEYCRTARDRGLKVIIAGAGLAAALPGSVAALTPLPVLGVPMESRALGGMDALLSMVQMPAGIPVGTLAIGKAGAKNAALLAAAILALSDDVVRARLDDFRASQTQTVLDLPPLK
ncbi:MAG: 5-(carboxyamino)imidazole ribonucleotide mutase [Gammaproteobacteria bacterium]|nr:5-(carboxyamino)imidazole ribonucleotide mutase [Gammaproteobacteria bacterium]